MEASGTTFCGRLFTASELELVREVVGTFGGLSRIELAHTVCELIEWTRPNGGLKARECLDLLERLERDGLIKLPEKRAGKPVGTRTRVPHTAQGDPRPVLEGEIGSFHPIVLEQVQDQEQRLLFRELVGRHHYLGHAVPFGAQLRYLAYASKPERVVVGGLQFSSPAWKMAVRDRWIGWDEATRRKNLQRIVNNSRFLILPWVRVRNLASTVLSLGSRALERDWPERYGIKPLLLETLVDRSRYGGGCYRAANWVELGVTAGRGRMDREHARHQASPKTVLIYPLARNVCRRLREG